MVLYQLIKKLR